MKPPARIYDGKGARIVGAVALMAMVGAGVWAAEHSRKGRRTAKRRSDMPALAGGKGIHAERMVTILRSDSACHNDP